MENYKTITGTYGSGQTPCEIFICETNEGTWYCIDGGTIVNMTRETLNDGVDTELIDDIDCFTVHNPIYGLAEFENAMNS